MSSQDSNMKVYIRVVAEFSPDGQIRPLQLTWEDGVTYDIDRVTDVRRAASMKAGGTGFRYTCEINGRKRYLYYEDTATPRWFVERK